MDTRTIIIDLKILDSVFCRNNGESQFLTFYEIVNIALTRLSLRRRLPSC